MKSTNDGWMAKVRQKYTRLLFLITASIPLALWWLLMLVGIFAGTIFRESSELGMDLFIVFVFPLVAAPILSGAALLIAKLFTVPIVRWVVVFGLGVIAPVSLYLLALVGHWIARMLYMGNKASIPSVPFGRTAVMIMPNLAMVGTSVEQKMEQLKEMLDKDLISFNDYERKKADILANM